MSYTTIERTIAQLRSAAEDFREATKISAVDKKGIGFNKDDRFSALKFQLSFDSWKGYYGNSACSKVISFPESKVVQDALVAYLNDNWRSIFQALADRIEADNEVVKAEHIAQLEAELARLKG